MLNLVPLYGVPGIQPELIWEKEKTMTFAFASGSIEEFIVNVEQRLKVKSRANPNAQNCVIPIGIMLVLDKANGGDDKAEELVRRFFLLDYESSEFIDFYYMGWCMRNKKLEFRRELFTECREVLRRSGIEQFGGNADVILVDSELAKDHATPILHFDQAIRIDLSLDLQSKEYPTVGSFLYAVVHAARKNTAVNKENPFCSPITGISNEIGLQQVRKSLLDYVLEKFGKIINAKQLQAFAVKRIGPKKSLSEIYDEIGKLHLKQTDH